MSLSPARKLVHASRWKRFRTWGAHGARALLLAVAILAVATAGIYWRRPGLVDRADAALVAAYTARSDDLARRAAEALARSPAQGIELFEQLLAELATVEKDERLSGTKRNAFASLAGALLSSGALERALAIAERWVAYDDRDLEARALHADLLCRIPLRGEEGLRLLGELFEMLPEDHDLARKRIERLLARRDAEGAAKTFVRHVRAAGRTGGGGLVPPEPSAPWQLAWSSGRDLRTEGTASLIPKPQGEALLVELTLPKGARTIVLRPPAHSWLELTKPELEVRVGAATRKAPLVDLSPLVRDLELTRDTLRCAGRASPELVWELPAPAADGGATLILSGVPRAPDLGWTRPVMALAETYRSAAKLEASHDVLDELAAARLRAVRRALLTGASVDIVTIEGEPASSAPLRARDGQGSLEFSARIVARTRPALRLSLPPVVGTRLRLGKLVLSSGNREELVSATPNGYLRLVDVRVEGSSVVVIGPHPSLEVTLPPGEARETTVEVTGDLR